MISFYPGPSRVHPKVPKYFQDAYNSGILSVNHRSKEFIKLYEETDSLLKEKLHIPKDYVILFTSSATESWEILAQSLTKKASFHIYNGAFGEKWFKYASEFHPGNRCLQFGVNDVISAGNLKIPMKSEMICLTHNETSNGTALPDQFIKLLRKNYPDQLICVDATSSMGGIKLDFNKADAWFASVQKCFGLQAGMGLLVCSPRLVERAEKLRESGRYNSFNLIMKHYRNWQTSYTPNILSIYLLKRMMQTSDPIEKIESILKDRYQAWKDVFSQSDAWQFLVENENVRSRTVIAIKGREKEINKVKARAKRKGFLLGSGYGDLKQTTFRIANFPALKNSEVTSLIKFFTKYKQ